MQVKFAIYQVPVVPNKPGLAFMNYGFWHINEVSPKMEMYDKVYERTDDVEKFDSIGYLEKLFNEFNLFKPKDFFGRCLSVSDVVVLNDKAYFCDSIGWKELTDF